LNEFSLVCLVPRRRALRGARAARAADVAQRTAIADQLLEQRLHELPRTHVLGLFLQPDNVSHRWIPAEHFVERDFWKRIELLDAADGDVPCGAAMVAGDQIDVDLSAAQYHAIDAVAADARVFVIDHRQEASLLELARRGCY